MFICRLSTNVEVFQSKEKPKKIVFRNELGEEFLFLCKQERKGDLRKDLRVMEYVSIVNHILAEDAEGQERHLQLTTLVCLPLSSHLQCVTILNEKSGLIEWVRNSEPMLKKLNALRRLHGMHSCSKTCLEIKPDFDRVQALMQNGQREQALPLYFNAVMPFCPPLLHLWLLNDFKDPRLWLQARTLYTETTALWSIVGYVIGLGDRHNDNILIQRSGAVSHIDFDCIFEKGTILPTPEVGLRRESDAASSLPTDAQHHRRVRRERGGGDVSLHVRDRDALHAGESRLGDERAGESSVHILERLTRAT